MSSVRRAPANLEEAKTWIRGLLQAEPKPRQADVVKEPEPVPMVVPSTLPHRMLKRITYWQDDEYGPGGEVEGVDITDDPAIAVSISSRLTDGVEHAPALDLDLAAHLFPSSTPGHSHLYLDVEMPWRTYRRLLKALARAGVIEKDWAKASIKGGQSLLRPPWKAGVGKPAESYTAVLSQHRMVKTVTLCDRGDHYNPIYYDALERVEDLDDATYVSSRLASGHHAPALDIDIPAALVPSSTPGHFHLYLDLRLTWRSYKRLLKALARAGVIESSWASASIRSEQTYLAPPWKPKEVARR